MIPRGSTKPRTPRGMVVLGRSLRPPQPTPEARTPLEQFLRAMENGYGDGESGWLR